MQGRANQVDQAAAIARVLEMTPHALALKAHVKRVVESPAFKGSRRSQEFLQFVTDKALDGRFEDLKERTLGVVLFGRDPSYDTGDDAIVRVTACDVRKRLTQFHMDCGEGAEFRIDLPPGSYIPELKRIAPPVDTKTAATIPATEDGPAHASETVEIHEAPIIVQTRHVLGYRIALAVAAFLLCAALWLWNQQNSVLAHSSPKRILPWSSLVQPGRQTHIIFCDPEIVTVQRLLNFTVSLSDYANRQYWPNPALVGPEAQRIMQAVVFRGTSVAAVDAEMALRITSLVVAGTGHELQTHIARSLRLADFKTDDGFILFGSPRSNPWVELFQDQLDFTFEFDSSKRSEFIRNRHPQAKEPPSYLPTAEGWGTGQAYAIVALVSNPNQAGDVLLLAGSNAEATEAAGKFATNLDLLSRTLQSHGIDPHGPSSRFELLLRVSTMAGSPNTFEVAACHSLSRNR